MESNTKQVIIESLRLTVRPLGREDVPVLALLGDDEVFELVPDIETPFDATTWVEHKLEREEPPICHVVLLSEIEMPIGFVQAKILAGQTKYEFGVGYWFGRDHWGNGYATEALCAVLENLIEIETESAKLLPLYAHAHERNVPSIRVLEKCGFALEGPALIKGGLEGNTPFQMGALLKALLARGKQGVAIAPWRIAAHTGLKPSEMGSGGCYLVARNVQRLRSLPLSH